MMRFLKALKHRLNNFKIKKHAGKKEKIKGKKKSKKEIKN